MILDSHRFLHSQTINHFLPVYLFVGDEEALIQKSFNFLKSAFLKSYGSENQEFSIEKFYGDKETAEKTIESCETFPFLSKKKLVILTHLEKLNDSSMEKITAYLHTPSTSAILALLWNRKPDDSTLDMALSNNAAKNGAVIKCLKPSDNMRVEWISERCSQYEKKITPEAAKFLSDEGGGALYELESEIEKLDLLTGEKKEIEISDVRCAMSFNRERSVWQLLDNLEKRDLKNSVKVLETCLEQGEEPVKILNLIARGYKRRISGQERNRHESTAGFSQRLSATLEEIKDADLKLKSGYGTESAILEKILLLLCQK